MGAVGVSPLSVIPCSVSIYPHLVFRTLVVIFAPPTLVHVMLAVYVGYWFGMHHPEGIS